MLRVLVCSINMSRSKGDKRFLKRKRYKVLASILVVIIVLALIVFAGKDKFQAWQKNAREEDRALLMDVLVSEINAFHNENGSFPEAVFFRVDSVLICSTIDCFINKEIPLTKSNRSAPDLEQKTNSKYTKYSYELYEDTFKLAFCDEDGNRRNYGKAPYGEELNCEK